MTDKNDRFLGLSRSAYYRKVQKRPIQEFNRRRRTGYQTWLHNNVEEGIVTNNASSTGPVNSQHKDNQLNLESVQWCGGDEIPEAPNTGLVQQTCQLYQREFPSVERTASVDKKEIPNPAVIEICALAQKHNITDECMEDLLKLFHNSDVVGNRNSIPKTVRGLESAFGLSDLALNIGWKCGQCQNCVLKIINHGVRAPNLSCCDKTISYNEDHFIYYSVKEVLKILLLAVQADFKNHNVADTVTISLNTDGAPTFKGSNSSIWPLLGCFDNTVYKSKKENVILFGVWVAPRKGSKPDFDAFLTPILTEFKALEVRGIYWRTANGDELETKFKISKVLCDSIARPLVQKMTQFNAIYGCPYCFHKESGHYFTHKNRNEIVMRTSADYDFDCESQLANSRSLYHRGVKGPSPLKILPYFDIIYGFPPDVLHAVYLGVTKQLTENWINSSNCRLPFYLKPSIQRQISDNLLCIKPPNRVSRVPRSLDYLKFYKGHELMMWLLYYSPVILYFYLKKTYYDHWMLLVRGISILTSECVTENEIQEAESLFDQFSKDIPDMYGANHQRFNVHLLLHFGTFVRRYGPMQDFSMTVFETFNMQLQSYVSSSNGVGRQICKRYFRDRLVKTVKKDTKYDELTLTGNVNYTPCSTVLHLLLKIDTNISNFTYYCTVKKGRVVVNGYVKKKSKLRDNTWVMLDDKNCLSAYIFAKHEPTNKTYVIGNCYNMVKSTTFPLPHCYELFNGKLDALEIPIPLKILLKVSHNEQYVVFKFLNSADAMYE